MKRLTPIIKQFSTKQNLTNTPAFTFLSKCSQSRFDLTSSEALVVNSAGTSFPKKILELTTSINLEDFAVCRGESRGEDYVLHACKSFFNRCGIKSELKNISLCQNILGGIDRIYDALELSKDRKILVPTPTFGYYFKNLERKNIGFETFFQHPDNKTFDQSENIKSNKNGSGFE